MIEVKNEDFEKYRSELNKYAIGLLKQKGSANTLYAEYEEKAKDIVQDCYLVFHKCKKDIFVTEAHLFNYLKICLYKTYQMSTSQGYRLNQYSILKYGNYDSIDLDTKFGYDLKLSEDMVDNFMLTLTENQRTIVKKLCDGFKMTEIASDVNISRQAIHSSVELIRKKYKAYEDKNSEVFKS
jgi:DNA-directed RNA polymerase specialized sigma24 family protein